jgi:hypothetical protein
MSGGSAPANTTTTTTINQSPWQNATYRALALGTPGNLGPVAQQLKIGQQLTNDWMNIQSGRNPGLYYGLQNATPERLAQENALRNVGFAAGRASAPTAPTPTPTDTPVAEAAQGGIMNLRGYAKGGAAKPKPKPKPKPAALARPEADKNESGLTATQQKQWDKLEALRNSGKPMTQQQIKAYNGLKDTRTTATAAVAADPAKQNKPTGAPFSFSDLETPTAFLDPNTGQNMLADAQLAYQKARELGTPEQIGQATEAYKSGIAGLGEAAKSQAKDVNAAQMAQYQQVAAQKADTERAAAAAMNRGDVREANALMAQVEKYDAAMMQAPTEANVRDYEAAQSQLNQMQGPKSWTDQGTAAQYMSPYMQNVVDIQKREADRDFSKQMARLDAQAAGTGAFGGSRHALERSEARRAQAQRLGDIQAQGQQQAYQSGMGQFSAEQGLGLQAGQANLSAAQQTAMANQQALNQQRQQYVNNALQAAMQSYGGQLTAEQQNQVAQNASSQFNAGAQNTAYNNYVQQQLMAQQANQQMDFGVGQMNTQNQQQANLANAAAANQANQQYAQLNLQGQLANQQAGLTTEQQNAQMRQQAALANQQAGLQSNQQNIGAYGAMGNMAQGLGGLGATQSQINLNNLAALGQSATAQTQFAQGALDRNTQNAINYYNLPTTFNAAGINALNAQPVSGGTSGSNTSYGQAKWFNKGGKVQWGPKK